MKLFTLLLFLGTFWNNSEITEITRFNDHQNIRWILNDKTNAGIYKDLMELNFVPQESSLTEELPYHLKYGGLTFKENGVLIEHIWNKCGTGNPPNSYESKWEISTEERGDILVISNSSKWEGKYLVKNLDSKKLNLLRLE
jgi:hypothetical protein